MSARTHQWHVRNPLITDFTAHTAANSPLARHLPKTDIGRRALRAGAIAMGVALVLGFATASMSLTWILGASVIGVMFGAAGAISALPEAPRALDAEALEDMLADRSDHIAEAFEARRAA